MDATVRVITALSLLIFVGIAYGGLVLERREGVPLVLSSTVIHGAGAILCCYLLYMFL